MSTLPQPLPPLATMIAVCREAREAALQDADREPALSYLRWRVDREPCLYAIDARGQRLNDDGWARWQRRKRDVEELLATYPDAVEVIVDSGVNLAASKEDYEAWNYEPQFWQATLWKRDAPVHSVEDLEDMLRRRSGFSSFEQMFKASANYRPSCEVSDPEMRAIADHYDRLAEQRGDDRRAYRYGEQRAALGADDTPEQDLESEEGMRP